jgi:hypothetical protein
VPRVSAAGKGLLAQREQARGLLLLAVTFMTRPTRPHSAGRDGADDLVDAASTGC